MSVTYSSSTSDSASGSAGAAGATVQAAPKAEAPEAAARDRQSSLPSARGQGPTARRGARGV
jgi:hypothetical protein